MVGTDSSGGTGRRRPATLADVARLAGVNPSTVSRALHGSARIRDDTRERVLRAAQELHYTPSRSARMLASQRSMTVGVLLPDLRNLMHADFLRGVQDVVTPRGYSLLICDGQVDRDVQQKELERLLEARVDALIVTRSFTMKDLIPPFAAAAVPVEPTEVIEGVRAGALKRRRAGSVQAFAELLGLGHRRIAFFIRSRVDAPRHSAEMRSRLQTLRRALADAGLDPEHAMSVVHLAEPAECIEALATLMASADPPTALIAGNDWMSAPLLRAVAANDLAIPQDVSVLCYGDSQWAEAYRPPIAVIRYDYRREGAILARRVMARLGVEDQPRDGVLANDLGQADELDTGLSPDEFVARRSLAAPPDRSAKGG